MKCWLHEIERKFLLNEKDSQKLPLKELEVDLVLNVPEMPTR